MEDEAGEIVPEEICMLYLGTWTLSNKRQGNQWKNRRIRSKLAFSRSNTGIVVCGVLWMVGMTVEAPRLKLGGGPEKGRNIYWVPYKPGISQGLDMHYLWSYNPEMLVLTVIISPMLHQNPERLNNLPKELRGDRAHIWTSVYFRSFFHLLYFSFIVEAVVGFWSEN